MKKEFNFKSRKEWENFVWSRFLDNIQGIKSKKHLNAFLKSLLSDAERKNLIKRIIVISLIKKGEKYREIEEILWLSPSTISSIKKSIINNFGYQSRRDIDKKKPRKANKIKQSSFIDSWFDFPPPPKMVGKGRWSFLYHH